MSISAMKCALQSLESVEKVNSWNKDSIVGRHCAQSAHFLRQAIAEAENVHAIDMSEKNVRVSDKHRHDPVPNDYDRSIHNNPDAQAWARFFINTVADQSWRIEDIDEGLMTGWFANAMMAMHDHVKREWVGLTDEEIKALPHWWPSYDQMPALMRLARDIENSLKEKNGG